MFRQIKMGRKLKKEEKISNFTPSYDGDPFIDDSSIRMVFQLA